MNARLEAIIWKIFDDGDVRKATRGDFGRAPDVLRAMLKQYERGNGDTWLEELGKLDRG